jgi:hypothetical protein
MTHPYPEVHARAPPGTDDLLAGLTPEQARAVVHGTGPLLLLGAPGAGKTRAITHRIAYLLRSGAAKPWEILAVMFSARAAGELRLRLADLHGEHQARAITAATFHPVCARTAGGPCREFRARRELRDPRPGGRAPHGRLVAVGPGARAGAARARRPRPARERRAAHRDLRRDRGASRAVRSSRSPAPATRPNPCGAR